MPNLFIFWRVKFDGAIQKFRQMISLNPSRILAIMGVFLLAISVDSSTLLAAEGGVRAQASPTILPILHRDWLEQASLLASGADGVGNAVTKLSSYPRAELVKAVRSWLDQRGQPAVQNPAYQTIVFLKLNEFKDSLFAMAMTETGWRTFHALNALVDASDRARLTSTYSDRLAKPLPAAASMAMIDGLSRQKIPLAPLLFRKLIQSPSYEVRQTAVRNFISTREKLADPEQLERLKASTLLKPYQVRLEAYQYFSRLPASEKKKLEPALSSSVCTKEPQPEVKTACAAALGLDKNAAVKK